ncbi:MAG TPA: hypothetical protein VLX92_07360 [Kofleriaceae bacterium]|nr:hypothetical protein [Kofleriaceae bacterium]
MNKLFMLLGLVLGLALAGCGPDDKLHLGGDAGTGSDAGPPGATLTSYVIDLVNNHSSDPTPAAYAEFSTLPDPDGSDNNTAAYSSLFP